MNYKNFNKNAMKPSLILSLLLFVVDMRNDLIFPLDFLFFIFLMFLEVISFTVFLARLHPDYG